ncbi:aldo/keto reductase [Holzapfeliella floricola]|uniref:aldo/keto reductase n=1 Tax=Holzapfeliella floricola TaxID=679249 RepID=UPI0012E37E2C|nr:aldo/keto reductase [Holzapfeliella floricola]
MPTVTLNNGVKMPQEGFGVFQIPDFDECKQAVKEALEVGYRLIDTAQIYQNESAVGQAIQESSVRREDIFITTKIWVTDYGFEETKAAVEKSMERLKTDYLDLVLLHQPFNDYYRAYQALEALYEAKKLRAIGVSNFYPDRYIDLANYAKVVPAVNQLEMHVFHQRAEDQYYLEKYGTKIESWGPFAEGKNGLFTNEVLVKIGQDHNKTAAQVALRYLSQLGAIIIPKSVHKERMQQNIEVWDFELTADEMAKIKALDLKQPLFIDHHSPAAIERFVDLKK